MIDPTLREQALARFGALGYPQRGDEAFKYTNVAPIAERAFAPGEPGEPRAATLPGLEAAMVFVNGHLAGRGASPYVAPLGAPEHRALVQAHLARVAAFEQFVFCAENTAKATDGALVHVPAGTSVEAPLHVRFEARGGAGYPRLLVVAGANSRVQVVEHHTGEGEGLANAVTEIVCGPGASVHHVVVQDQAPSAFHIGRVAVRQDRDSRFVSHHLTFGAALSRTDLRVCLDGEGAECTLEGAFALGGTQHADNDTFVDHAKPGATSRELYKGVLNGRSHGVFTGRVLVRPGATQTSAQQSNPNLLLSKSAHVDTRPQLEIHNNDVKCTHGATIGRLDADSLFFLRARGIDFVEARRLLVAAFGGEIAERVAVPGLCEWLYERIAAVGGAQ